MIFVVFFSDSTCVRSASKSTARNEIWTSTFAHYTGSERNQLANGAAKMILSREPLSVPEAVPEKTQQSGGGH